MNGDCGVAQLRLLLERSCFRLSPVLAMRADAGRSDAEGVRSSSLPPQTSVRAPAWTQSSGLSSRQLRARADSFVETDLIVLRNLLCGRRVVLEDIETFSRRIRVAQLLEEVFFVVGDDGRLGRASRITAVMSSASGRPAPPSSELWECASAEGVVQVYFGQHSVEEGSSTRR